MMKKVLVVAYGLPPVGGASVQRTTKFIKYLGDFGWEPVVLTVSNPSVPVYDPNQAVDIPTGTRIYRAKTLEPGYSIKESLSERSRNVIRSAITYIAGCLQKVLLVPDPQILWWPGLVKSLWKLIRKEKPDCLFVSAPPFSSLVPVVFAGKTLGIPVVVDFRDDWKFNRQQMENSLKTSFAEMMDRILERYVVLNCSAFTAATLSYVESISGRHSPLREQKGYVITNGYDSDDFDDNECNFQSSEKDQKIHFLYSGTVWRATSLRPFFSAVNSISHAFPHLRRKFNITIMGRIVESEIEYLNHKDLKGIVELKGYVPHCEIAQAMAGADVLILTLSDIPGARDIIPAKTFEYMATKKPILAVVPDGETSRILRQDYNRAMIFHPNRTDLIEKCILQLLDAPACVREEKTVDISKYERRFLTGKLAAVFSSLV